MPPDQLLALRGHHGNEAGVADKQMLRSCRERAYTLTAAEHRLRACGLASSRTVDKQHFMHPIYFFRWQ